MRTTPTGGGHSAVGLDIGSSGVRAVELAGRPGRRSIRACGQVGLPTGAVVDGEIRDQEVVVRAVQRLWADGAFTNKRVAVAVGGQRVIVRQADVPAMAADDFRTAMHFEVQDMIPIAVSDAVLDFQILGPTEPSPSGREQMRILLAAADRQTVGRLLDTVQAAGLEPVAVDVSAEAQLRGARVPESGRTVALVGVGASLTTVSLRCASGELFSRTLSLGAAQLTKGLGVRLGIEAAEAEAVKRYAGTDQPGAARAATLVGAEADSIVEQIVETLEYFWSQTGAAGVDELLLTGGGALTVGLVDSLGESVGAPARLLDPFEGLDVGRLALAVDDLDRLRPLALAACGLAGWDLVAPDRRFSLIPEEIFALRARRRAVQRGAAAVAALGLVLAGAGYERHRQITDVHAQTAAAVAHDMQLKATSASLQAVSAYESAVTGRQKALTSLARGIDWPSFYRVISAAMPSGTSISSITATEPTTGSAATTTPGAGSSSAAAGTTVTMSLSGGGDFTTVANWIRTLATLPALTDLQVPSSSTTVVGGAQTTTWTATATVTGKAPELHHPWEAK